MSKTWKITIIAFLGILTTAGYVYYQYNRKNSGIENQDPDYTVSVNEILNEFSSEQTLSQEKYIGKIVLVSGTLKSLEIDEQGNSIIVLGEEGSLSALRCSMDNTFSEKSIKEQKNLKLKGICTGYIPDDMGLGSDLILNKGVIIKN
jgi:hypothetical protein